MDISDRARDQIETLGGLGLGTSLNLTESNNIDEQAKNKLLFLIVIPMSFIIFILSIILIIILLTKSTSKIKQGKFYPIHCRKTRDSHTYTNNIMYRTNNNKLFIEKKNQRHVFPIKSELCIRRISSNPVHSTVSSQSLPSLVLPVVSSNPSQPLSVQRLYKNYV